MSKCVCVPYRACMHACVCVDSKSPFVRVCSRLLLLYLCQAVTTSSSSLENQVRCVCVCVCVCVRVCVCVCDPSKILIDPGQTLREVDKGRALEREGCGAERAG